MELNRRCHFSIQTQPYAGIYAETAKKKIATHAVHFLPPFVIERDVNW